MLFHNILGRSACIQKIVQLCERDQDLHWNLILCVLDDASVTARLLAKNLIEDALT
jgi:hypothetical protein